MQPRGGAVYQTNPTKKCRTRKHLCFKQKKTTTFSPVNLLTENSLPYIFIRKALTFLYFFILGLPAQASPHNRDVTGSPLTEAHSIKNNEAARNDPKLQALKKRAMEQGRGNFRPRYPYSGCGAQVEITIRASGCEARHFTTRCTSFTVLILEQSAFRCKHPYNKTYNHSVVFFIRAFLFACPTQGRVMAWW